MNAKLNDENTEYLYKAILELRTMEEASAFFEDLCTGQELRALSQRLQVAKLLKENNVYSDIVKKTGASTATISRVNRSLQFGANGYECVFDRMKEKYGRI